MASCHLSTVTFIASHLNNSTEGSQIRAFSRLYYLVHGNITPDDFARSHIRLRSDGDATDEQGPNPHDAAVFDDRGWFLGLVPIARWIGVEVGSVTLKGDLVLDDGPINKITGNNTVPTNDNVVKHLCSVEDASIGADPSTAGDATIMIDDNIRLNDHVVLDNTKGANANPVANNYRGLMDGAMTNATVEADLCRPQEFGVRMNPRAVFKNLAHRDYLIA